MPPGALFSDTCGVHHYQLFFCLYPGARTSRGLSDAPQQLWRIPVDLCPTAQAGFAQGQGAAAAAGCAAALSIGVPSCEAYMQNIIKICKEQSKPNWESGLIIQEFSVTNKSAITGYQLF